MNNLKKRIIRCTFLLAVLCIIGGFCARKAYASVTEPQIAPGRAIVCIRETGDTDKAPGADDKDGMPQESLKPQDVSPDVALARTLLDGGKDLIEVSGEAGEALLEQDRPDPSEESKTDPERMTLRLIQSDVYDTQELIEKLSALPEVLYAEPDYIIQIEDPALLQDPSITEPALKKTFSENNIKEDLTKYQYNFGNGAGGIDVPDWNNPENKNAEGVVVAILDTGINYEHPDLKALMWDEGLNYPSLTALGGGEYGICTASENTGGLPYFSDKPMDDNQHGTHCGGIVAAAWNGEGVSGAANGAKLMAIKAFDDKGTGRMSAIISGMAYALEAKRNGVNLQVINSSWATYLEMKGFYTVLKALSDAGIVSVFASGNENNETDYCVTSGNDFQGKPGSIVVNCSDSLGKRADFSNYGARTTDLFAPGVDIISTGLKEEQLACLLSPAKDASGRLMKNDFESGDYLTLENTGNQLRGVYEIKEDSLVPGNHVLKYSARFPVKNTEVIYELFKLSAPINERPESETGLKLVLSGCADADDTAVLVYVKSKQWDYRFVGGFYLQRAMKDMVFDLPPEADLDDLTFRFSIKSFSEQEPDKETEFYFDDIFVSSDDDSAPYVYLDGTSMSAPAVAGEAAILAAAFKEDGASKRVARILGSVKPVEDFSGLCVTGGMANVRNALEEDYIPVIDGIMQETSGELAISGYFFAEAENTSVNLIQEGKEYTCNIKELRRSNDDPDAAIIVFDHPKGLKSGEVLVKVTNRSNRSGRQTGSRYLSLSLKEDTKTWYERISLPVNEDYLKTGIYDIAVVKGDMFFTGMDLITFDDINTFRYRNGDLELIEGEYPMPGWNSNYCAFDGKLLYLNEDGLNIYDPEKNTQDLVPIDAFGFTPGHYMDLFYTGKELLLFNSDNDRPTEVWKLDPWSCSAENIVNLKAGYGARNLYGLRETDRGTEVYIGLGRMREGGEKTVMEKLVFDRNTGMVKREYVSKDILPKGWKSFIHEDNEFVLTGAGTKNGIYLTGGCKLSEAGGEIEVDNWYFDFDAQDKGFQPGKKKISSVAFLDPVAFSYMGKVYFYGHTKDADNECLLAFTEEETWDFGDQAVIPRPAPQVKITDLKINGESKLSLKKGQRGQLSCEPVYPGDMKPEDRPPLIYTAENDKLIKINPLTGEFLAYKLGSTTVKASCGDKTVTWRITISGASDPGVLEETLTMQEGEQTVLNFDPGYATGNEKVSWSSADPKIAAVKDGLITAKKEGRTLIRVSVKSGKDTIIRECLLTVTDVELPGASNKDKSVKLSPGKKALKTKSGETADLKVILSGKNPQDVEVEAFSSNTNVLLVSEDRQEKGTGNKLTYTYECTGNNPGTAYVIVKSINKNTQAENVKLCKVTVTAPAEEIDCHPDNTASFEWEGDDPVLVLKKGAYCRIYTETLPEISTDTKYTWKVKGKSVTVKNGVVYAKKESKKDKNGNYVPDLITVKCGKAKETIRIVVEK